MPVQDLREWIARVDDLGELTRVEGADPNLELGGLVDLYQWDMENPALLFEKIKGHAGRATSWSPTSSPRCRASASASACLTHLTRQQFVRRRGATNSRSSQPVAPRQVEDGPVLENRQSRRRGGRYAVPRALLALRGRRQLPRNRQHRHHARPRHRVGERRHVPRAGARPQHPRHHDLPRQARTAHPREVLVEGRGVPRRRVVRPRPPPPPARRT